MRFFVIMLSMLFLIDGINGQDILKLNNQGKGNITRELEKLSRQNSELYSVGYKNLENRLKNLGDKELLFDLYSFHANHLLENGYYDSSLVILHRCRNLKVDESRREMIPLYLGFASVFHYKANLDSLSYWQNRVARLIDKDSPYYARFLMNEGLKSQLDGNYNRSISAIIEAAQIFEKTGQWGRLALAYNNLAFNYLKTGDADTNIEYLNKSVVINRRIGKTYNLAMNYNNLGSSFREKNLLDQAIAHYDSAYQLLLTLNSPYLLAQNFMNRANIYKKGGELKRAVQLYLESLAICEENHIDYGKILNMLNLGNTYMELGQMELSAKYLEDALKLAKELQTKREEALIYERFSWLYRDMGDYKNAYHWQSKFYMLNDSLVNESVKKEAVSLREIYEAEKKENEILSLTKSKLHQRFVIAGMLIILLISLVLIMWWRGKHHAAMEEKKKQELKRKYLKEILESKDKELTALAAQLIQMQQLLETADEDIKRIITGSSLDPIKFKKIKEVLNRSAVLEVKKDFDVRITDSNRDYFKILLERYPSLKPAELKLCAYLRLSLSNKEIAEILNISIRTVETNRLSIRKKMELDSKENLVTHLLSLDVEV
jgi:DNA-binding CsgD family transcriptional regulator